MNDINKVLNCSTDEIIENIEFNISTKIELIVSELLEGRIDTLKDEASYIVCGDPSPMKVYEIESSLLKKELQALEIYELSAIWLEINDNIDNADFTDLEGSIDELDIFNYIYPKINFYENSGHSQESLLKLLDRQCWLENEIKKCNEEYSKLEDEILLQIEYFDDQTLLVPSIVTDAESAKFFYIYGKDINHLSLDEYKKHLLYKLTSLIRKEEINESLFMEINSSIESFEYFTDNSDFYEKLPPIYFAKEIFESEIFQNNLEMLQGSEVALQNLDSSDLVDILLEESDDLDEAIDEIIHADIYEVIHFQSDKYDQIVYNNSDARYDHDLSLFNQIVYSLQVDSTEEQKLWAYNQLKKELEDEHNTIRTMIQKYIDDELSEFKQAGEIKNHTHLIEFSRYISLAKRSIKNNLGLIAFILLATVFFKYYNDSHAVHMAKLKTEDIKEQKIKQELNASIQQQVKNFNAKTDWIEKLSQKSTLSRSNMIFSYELENLWIGKQPILFIGRISDIKIKNQDEYIVLIDRDYFTNETMLETDIQLELSAPKSIIDPFLKKHTEVMQIYNSDKGIAVIAKIDSLKTNYIISETQEKYEIKTGKGEMLHIQYMGKYSTILNN